MMSCNHENTTTIDQVFANGTKHVKESCVDCGAFIRWKPQGKPFVFPFGKYKGKTIAEIAIDKRGIDYLEWAVSNLDQKIASKIAEELKSPIVGA